MSRAWVCPPLPVGEAEETLGDTGPMPLEAAHACTEIGADPCSVSHFAVGVICACGVVGYLALLLAERA